MKWDRIVYVKIIIDNMHLITKTLSRDLGIKEIMNTLKIKDAK